MGEVGLGEGDGGVAVVAVGSELQATQVGAGEIGLGEVDGGVVAFSSELRATQVGVGETSTVQLDCPLCLERCLLEVAVRQVRPV